MTEQIDWHALDSFAFGDNPDLANELAALVVAGIKTATCWSAAEGQKGTAVGKPFVVLDGVGKPVAVIETVEFSQRRFDQVDAAFAFEEGEGDRSLEHWREAHRRYFTRLGQFAPDMRLNCERFRLVCRIDTASD